MEGVKSLQELCLTHVTMTVEQYSTDVLSLLPKKFREHLLHNIPVLDVCRLEEDISFTAGIDMETFWKELYTTLINKRDTSSNLTWKKLFFSQLFNTIIQGNRPYGYFCEGKMYTRPISLKIIEDQPVVEHKVDFVNFLVATKLSVPFEPLPVTTGLRPRTASRHEVTLVKGPVPPLHTYHKSCRFNQLVPPRYAKLFPEGSCYLPDSTALQLITEKCHFRPEKLTIDVSKFAIFVLNMKKECSVDCLTNCYNKVEFFSINDDYNSYDISGTKYENCTEGVICQLLKWILHSPNPFLASLSICVSNQDSILESIEPVLVRYGGLRKFSLICCSDTFLNFGLLSSIVEHQPLISKVLISESIFCPISFLSLEMPLLFLIQTCFRNPSFRELQLALNMPSTHLIIQAITVFLSTSCCHEQIFNLKFSQSESHNHTTHKSSQPLPQKLSTFPPVPPPLPRSVQSSDPPPTYQFDDALTLKYKCLSFDSCNFHNSFIDAFFKLGPLKIKKMSFQNNYQHNCPNFLSRLAQNPLVEVECLELLQVKLPDPKKEFFAQLSQKKFLKFVEISCSGAKAQSFNDATFKYFEQTLEHEGKTLMFTRK